MSRSLEKNCFAVFEIEIRIMLQSKLLEFNVLRLNSNYLQLTA